MTPKKKTEGKKSPKLMKLVMMDLATWRAMKAWNLQKAPKGKGKTSPRDPITFSEW